MSSSDKQPLVMMTPENIGQLWPVASPYLAAALEYAANEMTIEQLRLLIVQGRVECLVRLEHVACTGAIAYEFIDRPNVRVAFVLAIGGRGAYDRERLGPWKEYLKSRGCQRLEGAARPAIARLLRRLGMFEAYSVMRTEL